LAIGDNVIAILARWADRKEAVRRVLGRIAEREPARRSKALRQVMILAGLRKLAPEIEREAKQMPIMDDILDHEVLGREFKRGLAKGRIDVLRLMLEDRFGSLPQWAEERLDGASAVDFETIAKRSLHAHSLEEALG
jgi:hypothetical protein